MNRNKNGVSQRTGNNSGTITIKAGQTRGVLRITPTADVLIELDEMVIVTINQ